MDSKMLIDATHPEETRVVVVRGDRVEEFDYRSAAKKLLRGNIYLAKVTRVEPSLQAAFVDYGGNRHGFLAFNDIHPDYSQIPIADRQALIEAEARRVAEEEERAEAQSARAARHRAERRRGGGVAEELADEGGEAEVGEIEEIEEAEVIETLGGEGSGEDDDNGGGRRSGRRRGAAELRSERGEAIAEDPAEEPAAAPEALADEGAGRDEAVAEAMDEASDADTLDEAAPPEVVEEIGAEDAIEEVQQRRRRPIRSYKIQEVIRRRQIILIQVVKEERGNKGAALTTYLSLAGRYTVLMPNTARGGGISRKITNSTDRKRLKEIAGELEVPEGMGLIIRTAGASRTKAEIKRDFEYLMRLWESVRDLTLRSTAPALVYEEGNLIKRSIRDLYTKEIEDIVVAGDVAYAEARDFMAMLMPSHVRQVRHFQDSEPLFTRYQIERQLNAMYSPYVTLKSGGYVVINQTEALVSIDVNSGKSTREHSIEETAYSTNLEAASEIARQLRLRDLAGLIVIDFIDMEERRNNRNVERRLKDALKNDRARIQVGRISHFGLLEMSRQRLRTGVLEGSTSQCPHCQGTGVIRSTESVALSVLRSLEDKLISGGRHSLVATTSVEAALYILNEKRDYLLDIEQRYGVRITIVASERLHGANFTIERAARDVAEERRPRAAVQMEWALADDKRDDAAGEDEPEEVAAGDTEEAAQSEEDGDRRRSRRRRRRRRGERGDAGEARDAGPRGGERSEGALAALDDQEAGEDVADPSDAGTDDDEDEDERGRGAEARGGEDEGGQRRRSRRRGRRGGRRNRRDEPRGTDVGGLGSAGEMVFAVAIDEDGGAEPVRGRRSALSITALAARAAVERLAGAIRSAYDDTPAAAGRMDARVAEEAAPSGAREHPRHPAPAGTDGRRTSSGGSSASSGVAETRPARGERGGDGGGRNAERRQAAAHRTVTADPSSGGERAQVEDQVAGEGATAPGPAGRDRIASEAVVSETPEAVVSETPEAVVSETPEAFAAETPEAFAAEPRPVKAEPAGALPETIMAPAEARAGEAAETPAETPAPRRRRLGLFSAEAEKPVAEKAEAVAHPVGGEAGAEKSAGNGHDGPRGNGSAAGEVAALSAGSAGKSPSDAESSAVAAHGKESVPEVEQVAEARPTEPR
ncbi:MAG: Rne/Rng family ribonuclease, partial [Hyphomicrobiaceae bacterium]